MKSTYLRLKLKHSGKQIRISKPKAVTLTYTNGNLDLAELVLNAKRIEWLQENVTQLLPHIGQRRKMRPDTIRLDLISNAC